MSHQHQQNQDSSSFNDKMTGFLWYLNNLNQYTEDDFNKVAIRLYLQAVRTFNRKYIILIAALLTLYTQGPIWHLPKVADFNSQINHKFVWIDRFFYYLLLLIAFPVGVVVLALATKFCEYFSFFSYELLAYGHLTLEKLFITFILIGYIVLVCLLAQAYFVQQLLQLEKQLYQGTLSPYIYSIRLNTTQHIFHTCREKVELRTAKSDIADLIRNMPPSTINKKHLEQIVQLFPHFERFIYYDHTIISQNYHAIAPYAQLTINTPQDADDLLIYLGTYVQQHP